MITVNVRKAKAHFSAILDRVERGEEVQVTRHGRLVAVLTAPQSPASLPSLEQFRSTLRVSGQAVGKVLLDMRDEERL